MPFLPFLVLSFSLILALFYLTYLLFGPFYINQSNSVPKGVYIPTHLPIHASSYVVIPSSAVQGFSQRLPLFLIKTVLPYRGQLVTINRVGLFLNSTLIARKEADIGVRFQNTLPPDQVLLFGQSELSYDSRYFGPVTISDLTEVRPLFTW